jgi:hypothetical protein
MVRWITHQLERHHLPGHRHPAWHTAPGAVPRPAEAVDEDFAGALRGEVRRLEWHAPDSGSEPVRWRWPWEAVQATRQGIEVVERSGTAAALPN